MSTLTKTEAAPVAQTARRVEFVAPRVNLHQNGDDYVLEAEMPGVDRSGVEVTVEDGKLTLIGRRKVDEQAGQPIYRERSQADYRRVFDLDPSIDAEKISAKVEQGLLTVRLHKAEAAKPRKITIS
jgi:HSP20 family protein